MRTNALREAIKGTLRKPLIDIFPEGLYEKLTSDDNAGVTIYLKVENFKYQGNVFEDKTGIMPCKFSDILYVLKNEKGVRGYVGYLEYPKSNVGSMVQFVVKKESIDVLNRENELGPYLTDSLKKGKFNYSGSGELILPKGVPVSIEMRDLFQFDKYLEKELFNNNILNVLNAGEVLELDFAFAAGIPYTKSAIQIKTADIRNIRGTDIEDIPGNEKTIKRIINIQHSFDANNIDKEIKREEAKKLFLISLGIPKGSALAAIYDSFLEENLKHLGYP